ncbi:MAG: thiamine diphosphokinase [Pseudomonadota bacterium]
MKAGLLKFDAPVCLVGGGALTRTMLDEAMAFAPALIAADGAADRLVEWGLMPEAVIGDMDSIRDAESWEKDGCHFVHLPEQDSTDFGKCLYATEAPLYLAAGFTGRRIDHTLAAFSAMLATPMKTVVLIGEEEVVLLVPPQKIMSFTMVEGAVVSFFPLSPVKGTHSTGLRWSIDGLAMETGHQIGTSNEASATRVEFAFDRPGALLMLERRYLSAVIETLI